MSKIFRKQKGFSITIEVLVTICAMAMLLNLCVYIIVTQQTQKVMYNAYIATMSEASRWGGTSTSLYKVYGKTAAIDTQMETTLRKELPNCNVHIDATDNTNNTIGSGDVGTITVTVSWKDPDFWIYNGKSRTLSSTCKSIVRKGKLLN